MKIEKVLTLALAASATWSSIARANSYIDPLTQSYSVMDVDDIGGTGLRRVYSSTTIFRGHFGPGWCSEFDARVLFYSPGETRLRSCDLETAQLIDLRMSDAGVAKTATGFTWRRDDGAKLVFDADGWLEQIVRKDVRIQIRRDVIHRASELLVDHSGRRQTFQILTMRANFDGDASAFDTSLITAIGKDARFAYRDGLLVNSSDARYGYDDLLNMTKRATADVSEVIDYDRRTDRVVQVRRVPTNGAERLLVRLKRDEKSERIEIRIEVERGAETRPVLIFYDRVTKRLSLEGNRDVARLLLSWIRT